jgi:hypothetical protein
MGHYGVVPVIPALAAVVLRARQSRGLRVITGVGQDCRPVPGQLV